MKLNGIILTGTSGAGKTTIAKKILADSESYAEARVLTTRAEREDDEGRYIYVDDLNFEKMRVLFLTSTVSSDEKYAVTSSEIKQINDAGKKAIMIISPESYQEMDKECRKGFLSFFIDADDASLDERIVKRDGGTVSEEIRSQRKRDRQFADAPDYIVQNNDIEASVNVIKRLTDLFECGSFLAENDIKLMIQNGMLVKGATEGNVKGASYDLRLGDEYYYGGEIKKIEEENFRLTIEPYDYAIVSSKEEICLPKDVVAHFGLTVGLFCQGIILSNGQQVDPGFRGTLFCLLFNTSNRPVTIKRNEHYATIEFVKMNQFASKYKGKYQEKRDIIDVIPGNAVQGAINELKKEIEELKRESRNMQNIYISVITIIIAAISILMIVK